MNSSNFLPNESFHCLLEHCTIEIEETFNQASLKYFDSLFWIMTIFLVTILLPLNLAIIHYERFGGDSQKRSLGNRFTSHALIFLVICSFSLQTFIGFVRWVTNETWIYVGKAWEWLLKVQVQCGSSMVASFPLQDVFCQHIWFLMVPWSRDAITTPPSSCLETSHGGEWRIDQ